MFKKVQFYMLRKQTPKKPINISLWRIWLAESRIVFYVLKTLDLLAAGRKISASFLWTWVWNTHLIDRNNTIWPNSHSSMM